MSGGQGRNAMRMRRIFLAGMWIVSLIFISFFGNAVSYGFFWTVTLIGPVSLLYLTAVILRFKLYQELESRDCTVGQPVPYFFVLQNEDRFAFTSIQVRMYSGFSTVEELPEGIEYALLPGDQFRWRTNLICKYRGEYEVGVKEIIVTDFFRLFSLRYHNPGVIKALVSPRYVRLSALRSLDFSTEVLTRETPGFDASPAPDVREYRPGDDIRLLHWGASARAQRLLVRNRTGEERQGVSLYLDTRRYFASPQDYLPLENKMLEVFLALGGYFAERDMAFHAFCIQRTLTDIQAASRQDFESFSRFVNGIAFLEEEKTQTAVSEVLSRPDFWNSGVFLFVLHTPTDSFTALAEQLVQSGALVVLYLVNDSVTDTDLLSDSLRRCIVTVPTDARLEELL